MLSVVISRDFGGRNRSYRPFLPIQILLLLVLFRIVPCANLESDYLYNQRHLSDESTQSASPQTTADQSKSIPSFNERSIFDLEKMLAMQEMEQNMKVLETMKHQGYSIYGFYHTSTLLEYWREVVSEQLFLLDGWRKFPTDNAKLDYGTYEWDTNHKYTSLLNITEQLYMNVVGNDTKEFNNMKALVSYLMLSNRHKIYMNFNRTLPREAYDDAPLEQKTMYDQMHNISSGEYPTITKLYETCRSLSSQGKKVLVYYIHSKGSCCWKDFQQVYRKEKTSLKYSDIYKENVIFSPVSTWRAYLNAMILEFPSTCLRAIIEKNYSTCGVENQFAHYSGNFWWADCDHIAKLEPLHNRFDWRKPEFWVMFAHGSGSNNKINKRFAYRCGYAIFNCNMNLYHHECSRYKYRETLWNNAFSQEVSRSTPTGTTLTEDQASVCKELRSANATSYKELMDSLNKLFPESRSG